MFPQEAFREILLNAVVHKDYSAYNPIQISVYEEGKTVKIFSANHGSGEVTLYTLSEDSQGK